MQPLQLPDVLRAGGAEVDAGGVDGTVAQNVRQLHDVPAEGVKRACKEVAQIVGEHPGRRHPRCLTEPRQIPRLYSL